MFSAHFSPWNVLFEKREIDIECFIYAVKRRKAGLSFSWEEGASRGYVTAMEKGMKRKEKLNSCGPRPGYVGRCWLHLVWWGDSDRRLPRWRSRGKACKASSWNRRASAALTQLGMPCQLDGGDYWAQLGTQEEHRLLSESVQSSSALLVMQRQTKCPK